MTLTIEVNDDKAVTLLKQLGELHIIKLKSSDKQEVVKDKKPDQSSAQKETFGSKQQAELMELSGSLKMSPERFKEYEAFLHEIRNKWE